LYTAPKYNYVTMNLPIRIGCAGWTIPRESASHFTAAGSHLQRYSQTLNAVEINSSFYRPHKNQTWQRWAETVPADFKFSVKTPKSITHETRLDCGSELLDSFINQIRFLGKRLGPMLVQLPPSLEFEPATATKFLSLLRQHYSGDVAWEPRHRTWFEKTANEVLKEFKIARVAADPGCVLDAANPGGDEGLAYFRLHGSPRLYYSEYTDDFLGSLADQLDELAKSRQQVWCIFDNTALGFAMKNALELKAKLASREPRR
jgi:uncharacterized protein YecE (DUF72 family)